jgi:hypothetical protein
MIVFLSIMKNSYGSKFFNYSFLSGTYQNILFGCFNIGMQIWPIETLVLKERPIQRNQICYI